ncbi:hypothetical protein ACL02T_13720, partial [Pseudonocardia sp. RS010]|uniref:hypothetical protein n=1 Tax=Pseudonocardia sp. RS010 TaxID=3385979 RepID=UPI0039A0D5B8
AAVFEHASCWRIEPFRDRGRAERAVADVETGCDRVRAWWWRVSPGRQECVNFVGQGVKVVFARLPGIAGGIRLAVGVAGGAGGRGRRSGPVADVLYALLLVGGFAVLVLCLRGLERL